MKHIYLKKGSLKSAFSFGFLISLAIILGKAMYESNDISSFYETPQILFWNCISILLLTVLFSVASGFLFCIPYPVWTSHPFNVNRKHTFWILWLVFFICYVPAFLAYYPGIWSYDINVQIGQIITGSYNTYHPPLQTFLLELCVRICNWDYAHAVSLYGLLQMAFLASVFSRVICEIIERKASSLFIILSVLFFALNPVIAVFSAIPVKDVLCAGIFLMLTLKVIDLVQSPQQFLAEWKNWVEYALLVLLFCLTRNNAIYAVVVSLPIFYFVLRGLCKKLGFLLILPVVLYFLVTLLVYPMLGVENARGSEVLSVPLQQISNTVTNSPQSLTETDIAAISRFLPYEEIPSLYNPRFADPIRFRYDASAGTLFVLKEWLALLPSHLKEYINAFLALHIPYWYPLASAKDPFSGVLYIETNVTYHNSPAPFVNAGLCPTLLSFYESVADYSLLEPLPQFLNIFTLSFTIWFMLFDVCKLLSCGRSKSILVFCIPVLFWATYLLCPVSSLRYIFPLLVQYPLYFAYAFLPCNSMSIGFANTEQAQ